MNLINTKGSDRCIPGASASSVENKNLRQNNYNTSLTEVEVCKNEKTSVIMTMIPLPEDPCQYAMETLECGARRGQAFIEELKTMEMIEEEYQVLDNEQIRSFLIKMANTGYRSHGILKDDGLKMNQEDVYEYIARPARTFAAKHGITSDDKDIAKISRRATVSDYFKAMSLIAAIDADLVTANHQGAPILLIWRLWHAGVVSGIRQERARQRRGNGKATV